MERGGRRIDRVVRVVAVIVIVALVGELLLSVCLVAPS